ncbi:hypothetical protein [Myxosarcina sp. GI1]|uniref:hypothetical protein n=1 Tax=Myxosarcina sp. GI1 TaxID=1541065 RepID=UPI00055E3C0D|nr:hypothetical protein [Myxosarcina sp. GI1]
MKIKVLGGSLQEGNWDYIKLDKSLHRVSLTANQSLQLKNNIKSVTILDKENIKSFIGTAGWGFLGSISTGFLLGGVGALAGLGAGISSGGNKSKLTIAVELVDDSKFVAVIPTKLYGELESLTYSSTKSSLVQKRDLFGLISEEQGKQASDALSLQINRASETGLEWFKKRNSLEKFIIIAGTLVALLFLFGCSELENNTNYKSPLLQSNRLQI